ncbi:hypothetical protein IWZ01DRAFT_506823 [Phyllosticta capitalensis]
MRFLYAVFAICCFHSTLALFIARIQQVVCSWLSTRERYKLLPETPLLVAKSSNFFNFRVKSHIIVCHDVLLNKPTRPKPPCRSEESKRPANRPRVRAAKKGPGADQPGSGRHVRKSARPLREGESRLPRQPHREHSGRQGGERCDPRLGIAENRQSVD